MASDSNALPLFAGGVAGTVAAVLTCPLEVVKTRLQSSLLTFHHVYHTSSPAVYIPKTPVASLCTCASSGAYNVAVSGDSFQQAGRRSVGLIFLIRHIQQTEGIRGLYKGLGPNLVGVAPSRAIYFYAYANTKKYLNTVTNPDTPLVHLGSATAAGVTACTATNPIWFVKTRLQLDQKRDNSMSCRDCIRGIYRKHGLVGFYKGITASYFGVSETIIHFVIYEELKARLFRINSYETDENVLMCTIKLMLAASMSKTCATTIAYPHEVARTRLREEGNKYNSFVQTLLLTAREEGMRGLYRGLCTQLVRQIPNTACMFTIYELIMRISSTGDAIKDDV